MKASTPTPKFIPISSGASSVAFGPTVPLPNTAYVTLGLLTLPLIGVHSLTRPGRFGASKAALNFVTRKMRAENDGLSTTAPCSSE
jgi:hypothetical protein